MRTLRNRLLSAALIASVAAGLAACERDEPDASAAAPTTTEAPAPTGDAPAAADPVAFCEAAAPLLVVVPREFVGTDEHVALFDDLAAVAPDELQDDIALLRAHYQDHVSPANPASQDFENFPPDVQEAALRLSGELTDRC